MACARRELGCCGRTCATPTRPGLWHVRAFSRLSQSEHWNKSLLLFYAIGEGGFLQGAVCGIHSGFRYHLHNLEIRCSFCLLYQDQTARTRGANWTEMPARRSSLGKPNAEFCVPHVDHPAPHPYSSQRSDPGNTGPVGDAST